ncbi:MAG: NUDIX hydrolase [Dehalococcoidia bacterium]
MLRRTTSGVEVVLCYRESEKLWALPKGTPEEGESREETARREVEEESGITVESGPSVGETRYSFVRDGFQYEKVVYFYLMRAVGGDLRNHDTEFDLAVWVPVDQALEKLTFKNESRVLEKALPMEENHKPSSPSQ